MSMPPERAAQAIRAWFARLPDQNEMRTLTLELPDGRNAPNADGFIVPTRVAVEDGELAIDLDAPMQLRVRGLENVRPVSETELRLDGFDELDLIWDQDGERRTRRYRDGNARFVSSHLVRTYREEPRPGVRWENPI